MTYYDFTYVKSTSASPFWGPSVLDISIYSDSVTSQRDTTTLWGVIQKLRGQGEVSQMSTIVHVN